MAQDIRRTAPRLLAPKIAAVVLGLYAIFYACLLLSVSAVLSSGFVIAMLALATTPFFAFFQLHNAEKADPGAPVRPVLMAFVMAAPSAFWLFFTFSEPGGLLGSLDSFVMLMGITGIPGVLSFWLMVVFIWLAVHQKTNNTPDSPVQGPQD